MEDSVCPSKIFRGNRGIRWFKSIFLFEYPDIQISSYLKAELSILQVTPSLLTPLIVTLLMQACYAAYDVSFARLTANQASLATSITCNAVFSNGDVVVGGWTAGLTGFPSAGGYDFLLQRYSSTGTLVWTKVFGGAGHDYIQGVDVDSSDNIYVAGYTYSAPASSAKANAYIAKFTSSGNQVYANQYPATGHHAVATAAAVDSARGVFFVTGYSHGSSFEGMATSGGTAIGAYLLQLNANTGAITAKSMHTAPGQTIVFMGVTIDSTGAAWIAGHTSQGVYYGKTTTGNYDILVHKFSSTGASLFSALLGGTGVDHASGIVCDANDNVYVTGGVNTAVDSQPFLGGGYDILVAKFSSAGVKSWTRLFGSAGAEYPGGIAFDPVQQLVLTAGYVVQASTFYGVAPPSTTLNTPILLAINTNGDYVSSKMYPATGYSASAECIVTRGDMLYMAGISAGNFQGQTKPGTAGINAGFVMKIGEGMSVVPVTTVAPTRNPSSVPTINPTLAPTKVPSAAPSLAPTRVPTAGPTANPTVTPSRAPTAGPSAVPTVTPSRAPTAGPTADPTVTPTAGPSAAPTVDPTQAPTADPTASPSADPTVDPTQAPTVGPSADPTADPSVDPTQAPTASPSADPTVDPTQAPTASPSANPTVDPTHAPTASPSADPTVDPTQAPTASPSADPTVDPTQAPTASPSANPTVDPTHAPTASPSADPTGAPTVSPSLVPTASPTIVCVQWALGDYGESCSATCGKLSRTCKDSYLKNIVTQEAFYAVVGSAVNVRSGGEVGTAESFCSLATESALTVGAPAALSFVLSSEDHRAPVRTSCSYPASAAEATLGCDAVLPLRNYRRFCPCVHQSCDGSWYLGHSGDSCDATCSSVGGVCDAEPLSSLVHADVFSSMVASAVSLETNEVIGESSAAFCQQGINVLPFASAPAVVTLAFGAVNDTLCVHPTDVFTLQGSCDLAFSNPPAQRFCNCKQSAVPPVSGRRALLAFTTATPYVEQVKRNEVTPRLRGQPAAPLFV